MTRLFVIFFVLVITSITIGHKVLTVPITIGYVDDIQNAGSTANLHSDLENVELIDEGEGYEIHTDPGIDSTTNIQMYYPELNNFGPARFTLDLNSSWMTAPLRGCSGTCLDDDKNIPKQFHDCEDQITTVTYESIEAQGKICKSTISVQRTTWYYVSDMSIVVFDQKNFSNTIYLGKDGIMGIAPTASPGSELFVEVLKRQGIIDVLAFNIDYRYFFSRYSMTFGGINTERAPSLDNFTFTDLYEENSWTVEIKSMRYSGLEFGGQATKGFFDTNIDFIRLPPEDYKRWADIIVAPGRPCEKRGIDIRCKCENQFDESLLSFHITLGCYTYTLESQHFVRSYFDKHENHNYCDFKVRESEDPSTVTLGLPFLKNFNVYFDMEKKRIGIYQEGMMSSGGDCGGSTCSGFIHCLISKICGLFTIPSLGASIFILSLIFNMVILYLCCIGFIGYRRKYGEDDEEEPLIYKKLSPG